MVFMVKISIITDIHGNPPALEAVLNDIGKRNIDHIYCLGDLLAIGPYSNEVLQMLLSRQDISYVVGNHDLAVIAAFRGEEPPKGHHLIRQHHEWIADRLDSRYIEFLTQLPLQIEETHEGKKILFTHYHLDNEEQFSRIDEEPTASALDSLYENTAYDLVCFGHHHIVHNFNSVETKRKYFNPGALGCYDKPLARYGVVELTEKEIKLQALEIPYDNKPFLRSYLDLDIPERDFILRVFHGGQLTV